MTPLAKRKIYNQRYREKQARIKAFAKQLDELERRRWELPLCADCQAGAVKLVTYRPDCTHTPERHRLNREAALVRAQLEQVDH